MSKEANQTAHLAHNAMGLCVRVHFTLSSIVFRSNFLGSIFLAFFPAQKSTKISANHRVHFSIRSVIRPAIQDQACVHSLYLCMCATVHIRLCTLHVVCNQVVFLPGVDEEAAVVRAVWLLAGFLLCGSGDVFDLPFPSAAQVALDGADRS